MKKYWQFLTVLFVCCVLVGCGSKNNQKLLTLSGELKEEVEAAWLKKEGHEINWYDEKVAMSWASSNRYYGTYQDAVVIFVMGDGAAMWEITVAGETFEWSSTFGICVYKDNEFYSLEQAYDLGLLSQENIKSIAEYHEWFGSTQRKVD